MVNLFVAVTDYEWFRFLETEPGLEEVNFWQPGGRTEFKALQPGELFLFKLHSPHNFIAGGGIYAHASILPVSIAWEAFGRRNGVTSLKEMRARIARYRREPDAHLRDYQIGCRILEAPFFLPREHWISVPPSWSPNIVVGKKYSTDAGDGRYLWDAMQERLEGLSASETVPALSRHGPPTLIIPRLGQGAFRVAVTDAYQRACAVTGERTLPALDAAHIRPFAEGGANEVRNGLLLRSDIHKLFDRGYVTVTPTGVFEVSRRIKEEFANGRWYYALHGQSIAEPRRGLPRPSTEALEWHNERVYLG